MKAMQGPVFDLMKTTRARFKYALRYCKSIETRAKADALANKLLLKDDNMFWKDVKKLCSSGNNVLPNMVDDVVGEKDIANMWQNHYYELLNSNKDVSHKEEVLKSLDELPCNTDVRFDIYDVAQSIKNLKCSKSPGLDGLDRKSTRLNSSH